MFFFLSIWWRVGSRLACRVPTVCTLRDGYARFPSRADQEIAGVAFCFLFLPGSLAATGGVGSRFSLLP